MIRMSTSPSLSKSPKAQPRKQCGAATPGPASSSNSSNLPRPAPGTRRAASCRRSAAACFHLRINAAGNQKKVRPAVVIQVHKSRAPAHEPGLHRDPRLDRHILEVAVTRPCDRDARVVGEVRLEDVQAPVQVEVAHANPMPACSSPSSFTAIPRSSPSSAKFPSPGCEIKVIGVESHAT